MSTVEYYEEGFKNSRNTATTIANEIRKKLSLYDETDAKKRMNFCNVVFRGICRAVAAKADYFDIYSSVLLQQLLPNMDPSTTAAGWNGFLKCLKYFHAELCASNRLDDASKLVKWINSMKLDSLLQAADSDFRPLFGIFCKHFFIQCWSSKTPSPDAIRNIINLFNELCQRQQILNVSHLLEDFRTNIFASERYLKALTDLPTLRNERAEMFEGFFRAINCSEMNCKSEDDAKLIFIDILKMLKVLIQFDIMDRVKTSAAVSLNYLRVCRGLDIWNEHNKYLSYILSLFYYYQKLLYNPCEDQFRETLQGIFSKITSHLDKISSCAETWSMETIITFIRILSTASASGNGQTIHHEYWQQMDDACYSAKVRLFEKIVKLAPGVHFDSGGVWSCCNSVRKHLIFMLCQQELELYCQYIQNRKKSGYHIEQELSASLCALVKHTVAVAETMKCPLVPNACAQIAYHIVNIAQHANTKIQADCCWKMTEFMVNIRKLLSANMWQKVCYSLIKPVRTAGDWKKEMEAYALNAALILSSPDNDISLARRYISLYYQMEKPPEECLVELLDGCRSRLKCSDYNRRTLHALETSVAIKTSATNILVMTSLLKCCETDLDFVLLVRNAPDIDVTSEMEDIHSKLKRKHKTAALNSSDQLAWGHLCKWLFANHIEKMANQLPSGVKYNDEGLQKLLEDEQYTQIQRIDVASELHVIRYGLDAIEAFDKFFVATGVVQETPVDWEAILDDLSYVARWLQFRGYIGDACRAWLLFYRIATIIQDLLNQIRALSFMFDESEIVLFYDPNMNFENEITALSPGIMDSLLDLQILTPRRQNYVLLCICSLAKYYAKIGQFALSQMLLNMVEQKIEELTNRQGQYDLVKAKHNATVFYLECHCKTLSKKNSPLQHIDRIIDRLRSIVYVTSEDSVNYPLLLFTLIGDLAQYLSNRLIDSGLSPYFQMVLKLALDFGASLRIVHVLAMWAHVQLQTEEVEKAQIKLRLIDCFLRVVPDQLLHRKNNDDQIKIMGSSKVNNEIAIDKINNLQISKNFGSMETVRKVLPVMLSPIRTGKLTVAVTDVHIEKYLTNHIEVVNPLLDWLNFEAGCLNARLLYLIEEHSSLEQFYSKAVEWCASRSKDIGKYCFRNYEMKTMIQFVNYLRYTKNYQHALKIINDSGKIYEKWKTDLDTVYQINLWNQQQCSEIPAARQRLSLNSRRVLDYDSPLCDTKKKNFISGNEKLEKTDEIAKLKDSTKAVNDILRTNGILPSSSQSKTRDFQRSKKVCEPPLSIVTPDPIQNHETIEIQPKTKRKNGIRQVQSAHNSEEERKKKDDKVEAKTIETKQNTARKRKPKLDGVKPELTNILPFDCQNMNMDRFILPDATPSTDVIIFTDSPEVGKPVHRSTRLRNPTSSKTPKTISTKQTRTIAQTAKQDQLPSTPAEMVTRTARLGLRRQRSELTH